MTPSNLQQIEQELGISLPTDYISAMTSYPFPEDSYTFEFLLTDMAERLLDLQTGYSDILPSNSFVIGSDGGEELYFIDLACENSSVNVFEYETPEIKLKAVDINFYLQQCRDSEEKISKDEEFMARKKWWQFWR